jgi:hypothetical protein
MTSDVLQCRIRRSNRVPHHTATAFNVMFTPDVELFVEEVDDAATDVAESALVPFSLGSLENVTSQH